MSKGANATLTSIWGRKALNYFQENPLPKLKVKNILLASPKVSDNEGLVDLYVRPNQFTMALLVTIAPTETSETDYTYLVTLELYHRFRGQISYHAFLANMKGYLDTISKEDRLGDLLQQKEEQYEINRIENLNLSKIHEETQAFMTGADEFMDWYTFQIIPTDDSQKYTYSIVVDEDVEILDTIEINNTFFVSSIDYPIQILQELRTGEEVPVEKFFIRKRKRIYNKRYYPISLTPITEGYDEYLVQEFKKRYYVAHPLSLDVISGVAFPLHVFPERERIYYSLIDSMTALQIRYSLQNLQLPLYAGGRFLISYSHLELDTVQGRENTALLGAGILGQFGSVFSVSSFDFSVGLGMGYGIEVGPKWQKDDFQSDFIHSLLVDLNLDASYNINSIYRVMLGSDVTMHYKDITGTNSSGASGPIATSVNLFSSVYAGVGMRF